MTSEATVHNHDPIVNRSGGALNYRPNGMEHHVDYGHVRFGAPGVLVMEATPVRVRALRRGDRVTAWAGI